MLFFRYFGLNNNKEIFSTLKTRLINRLIPGRSIRSAFYSLFDLNKSAFRNNLIIDNQTDPKKDNI